MTTGAVLLLAVPMVPLLVLLAWCVPGGARLGSRLLPLAPVVALMAALLVPVGTSLEMPALLLGAEWRMHGLARPLLAVTALVWMAAGHYVHGYLGEDPHRARFELLWLTTLAGNLGLVVAVDIASFYTFFGMMTFAAYGLVIHDGSRRARHAGRVYLVMALVGEVLLLAGFLLAAGQLDQPLLQGVAAVIAAGAHDGLVATLLIAGFGVKAGLPLLHMWLPLAHPAAPTPASAVLSGAMIKAGLLGWLQVLPLGVAALPGWGALLSGLGCVAAFGAALLGVVQRQPKAVLAYSSISQMGVMTGLVGIGLLLPSLWPALLPAVLLFAVHHGVAKGALFLGVGVASHGGGLPRWLLVVGWLIPALALAGAPLSSGALVKSLAKKALHGDEAEWLGHAATLLALSSVATAALMARYGWRQWQEIERHERRPSLWPGWMALLLLTLAAPVWLPLLAPTGKGGEAAYLLDPAGWWPSLWPILLVIAAAILLSRWRRSQRISAPEAPPGDVLILLAPLGRRSLAAAGAVAERSEWVRNNGAAWLQRQGARLYARADRVRAAEELASRYGGHALVAILLILGLLLL